MLDLQVAQVDSLLFMIALLLVVVLTANDIDVDVVDWSEAAKNLLSAIGDILLLTDAATLQVTPKRKARIPMQGKSSTSGERRQTYVDVEALNQGGHSLLICNVFKA